MVLLLLRQQGEFRGSSLLAMHSSWHCTHQPQQQTGRLRHLQHRSAANSSSSWKSMACQHMAPLQQEPAALKAGIPLGSSGSSSSSSGR
jgi:hypothetical protein